MTRTERPAVTVPRREVHNLFFALWPDPATRERMAEVAAVVRNEHVSGGRWLRPDRYHLTLQFLGEHASLPADLVDAAMAAGAAVRVPAFDLELDMAGSFGTMRMPCWLGCSVVPAPLQRLFDQLARRLVAQRCRVHGHARLAPHVTILRDADRELDRRLGVPLRWSVDEFVLIDSRIEPFAPYRILGRWPLLRAG